MLDLAMARHELEAGQTELLCAIDQRHDVVIPEWVLHELEDEGVDRGVDPRALLERRTGFRALPGFPPEDRPVRDDANAGEWSLDRLAHEGEDEAEDEVDDA